ncbi:MAG: SUMF1/EgtB/PvdO family nonheme iron enzyme [Chloroflexota bacterium]|nr:SUMF1/EgtB/PvdO family nonheme iron enzyme [Chloroflexota bacterium]MDE2911220.1 SUMF1/EgtB/PvdO family nonheme iron enzyme [Chloroflexota bacterium]
MKIFVCYARVDKPYCIRIIETLQAHELWYDQRLYAGQDWWKEILRRLDWCDAFIYLLSPDSVASLYCRRELEIALRLKRDIIPVLINRETVLPENMKDWQYIDLCDNLTVENVSQLLSAILVVERQRAAKPSPPSVSGDAAESRPAFSNEPAEMISNAVSALEKGDYDNAILLLKQARASGYQSRFVSLDKLLRIAEGAVADQTKTREVQREYQHIVALFSFESTRELACEALAEFEKEFGDYDPQGLRRLCDSNSAVQVSGDGNAGVTARPSRPKRQTAASGPQASRPEYSRPQEIKASSQTVASARERQALSRAVARQDAQVNAAANLALLAPDEDALSVKDVLPMLQWRDVPHGAVTISSIMGADEDFGEVIEQVDNFVISKYPVTNAQFAIFAGAEDGYRNPRWWEYSEHARRWFKLGKGVAESRFSGDAQPRENVNWYEAMALANWLGNLLGMKITLPTIAQWQRAAKGDDDRYFPWGDEYDEEHCNTLETGLKTTTPVDRYQRGASPYGVYDMAGNVWEWTLNSAAAAEAGRDSRRAVAGGSFVSPCDRAHTSFRYYLDPRVRYSSIGIRLVGLT